MINREEKRKILKSMQTIINSNYDLSNHRKEMLVIDLQAMLVLNNYYCFIDLKSIERLLFYKIERGLI